MPKLKTNKGAAKRFKKVKNGFKCKSSHHNHILTKKSPKRKRQLRPLGLVVHADQQAVKRLLQGA